MKKSISYLPSVNQRDLHFLVESILTRIKQTEMIILFGSYARNDYVVYDEKYEFGKLQFYVSDYDILIVTKQEGVVLYDSGKHKLARRRKLSFDEIKQQAQEYFDAKFERANGFFRSANHCYDDKDYVLASFMLHQTCENYIYAIRLVSTLENPKQHNLTKLLNSVKKYSDDFIKVFPQDTLEEKRLFELVKAAYVEGWYNPDFIVTKEDIDALIPKVELLRDITKRICEEKIKEYGEREWK